MEQYLNSRQACDFLGIKELNTLYGYIKDGMLKAYKLGGGNSRRHWRIKREDLESFVTGQEAKLLNTESEEK